MNLQDQIKLQRAQKEDEYLAVLAGEPGPPCYTCKAQSTHVSKRITPAGYHAYQCPKHAIDQSPDQLWGSDPGWLTQYQTIADARAKATGSTP